MLILEFLVETHLPIPMWKRTIYFFKRHALSDSLDFNSKLKVKLKDNSKSTSEAIHSQTQSQLKFKLISDLTPTQPTELTTQLNFELYSNSSPFQHESKLNSNSKSIKARAKLISKLKLKLKPYLKRKLKPQA